MVKDCLKFFKFIGKKLSRLLCVQKHLISSSSTVSYKNQPLWNNPQTGNDKYNSWILPTKWRQWRHDAILQINATVHSLALSGIPDWTETENWKLSKLSESLSPLSPRFSGINNQYNKIRLYCPFWGISLYNLEVHGNTYMS